MVSNGKVTMNWKQYREKAVTAQFETLSWASGTKKNHKKHKSQQSASRLRLGPGSSKT